MTSVRHRYVSAPALLAKISELIAAEAENSFAIGDLVNQLKREHGMTVKEIAVVLGASRQRLGELRRTALAFPPDQRKNGVHFHFYTLTARAAHRLGLNPAEVLDDIIACRIDTTRKATAYLAQKIRTRENLRSRHRSGLIAERLDSVTNRCHRCDYRDLIQSMPDGSVKLVVADPPYGQYGQYADGKHTEVAATRRQCDGLRMSEAREVTVDLFRLLLTKLTRGGCMIVFRPGGSPDPSWLMDAATEHGWSCRHALTWAKGSVQPGNGADAYSISSERLLVFARYDESIINHDGSDRSDVIRCAPVRPTYATGHEHHLFEKPVELMRRLIMKHTYEGELVMEPFGGTGPVSVAAIQSNRKWIYSESNPGNFDLGVDKIDRTSLQPVCH